MKNAAVFIEFDFRYYKVLFFPGWTNGGPFTVEQFPGIYFVHSDSGQFVNRFNSGGSIPISYLARYSNFYQVSKLPRDPDRLQD